MSTSILSFQKDKIPSFNEFEHHITEFDDNFYFTSKNSNNELQFDDKIDNFFNFLQLYKKIEEDETKKNNIFRNNGSKKGNNYNQSGYSYTLNNYQKTKNVKSWNAHVPKSNDEKMNVLIESYLNKISDESYKTISSEFMNELIKIDNMFYFDIIVKKIVDKCVMDNKYQHLYLQLCNKIWSNRQIHYHLATIKEENKKFTWTCKYNFFEQKKQEVFGSEIDAKMNIFHELNFKKYFMNYIQDLFINKNVNFTNIENDQEFFLHKRQFMVIIEILGIMYLEKYIPVDILHIVCMKLLHMNDIDINIESIEIDGFLNILKIMNSYKDKYAIVDYFDIPIFDEYYHYILHIEGMNIFNKRTMYFLQDCKDILKKKYNTIVPVTQESSEDELFQNFMNEKKKKNVENMMILYSKVNESMKEKYIYSIIYRYFETNNKDEVCEEFLNTFFDNRKSGDKKLFMDVFSKLISNCNDIYLDIPDIISILRNFTSFVESLNIYDDENIDEINEQINAQEKIIESLDDTDEFEDSGNFF